MSTLPPGTILAHMYLRDRLRRRAAGHFVEVGPGQGDLTALLLDLGWRGTVLELGDETAAGLEARFHDAVAQGRLTVRRGDFLDPGAPIAPADLVIASMVIEHLDEPDERAFLERARQVLRPSGLLIGLVPAGAQFWGIEDEIAGHFRRYDRDRIRQVCGAGGWQVQDLAGLTFPLSNLLRPWSNRQVARHEGHKVTRTMRERTTDSGRRDVPYKTSLPALWSVVVNPITLAPWHGLQRLTRHSDRCMILYFEATP